MATSFIDIDLYYEDFENHQSELWLHLNACDINVQVLQELGPAGGNPWVVLYSDNIENLTHFLIESIDDDWELHETFDRIITI